jgi:hypothetical protein
MTPQKFLTCLAGFLRRFPTKQLILQLIFRTISPSAFATPYLAGFLDIRKTFQSAHAIIAHAKWRALDIALLTESQLHAASPQPSFVTAAIFAGDFLIFCSIEKIKALLAHAAGFFRRLPLFTGNQVFQLLVCAVYPGSLAAMHFAGFGAIAQPLKLAQAACAHPPWRMIEAFPLAQMFQLQVFIPDKGIFATLDPAGKFPVFQFFQRLETFFTESAWWFSIAGLQLHAPAPDPCVFAAPHAAGLFQVAAFPDFLPASRAESLWRRIAIASGSIFQLLETVPGPRCGAARLRARHFLVLQSQKKLMAFFAHFISAGSISPGQIMHGLFPADMDRILATTYAAFDLRLRKQIP